MTPPSDSTDKPGERGAVRRYTVRHQMDTGPNYIDEVVVPASDYDALQADRDQCFKDACELKQLAVETVALFSALQARYDALEKSRSEFIKRSADYAAEIAALRKSVQLVLDYGDPPRDEHAFTRFAYHELKRAATASQAMPASGKGRE